MSNQCELYHFTFIHETELNLIRLTSSIVNLHQYLCDNQMHYNLSLVLNSIHSGLFSKVKVARDKLQCSGDWQKRTRIENNFVSPSQPGKTYVRTTQYADLLPSPTKINWTTCEPSGPSFWSIYGHEHTRCLSRVLQFSYWFDDGHEWVL